MNLSSSLLIPRPGTSRLRHLVIDNGANASTGGQPSLSDGIDITGLARAFGYQHVQRVDTPAQLRVALARPAGEVAGPELIHCRTVDDVPPGRRVELALPTLTRRFAHWLETQPCPA